MSDSGRELEQIPQLEKRIAKYDSSIERITTLHDQTLGTPEGPPQYDLSLIDKDQYPDFYTKAENEVRGVKLQLANKTFEGLLQQRDALSALLMQAQNAETEYARATEVYLMSNGTQEDGQAFDEAHTRLQKVKEELASVFQPRTKNTEDQRAQDEKEKEDAEQTLPTSEETPDENEEAIDDAQEGEADTEEKGLIESIDGQDGALTVVPAKLGFDQPFLDHVVWATRITDSRIPVVKQLESLAITVAEIRSGKKPTPSLGDLVAANDAKDESAKRTLATTGIQGLIATRILLPDGTIDPSRGLPARLAQELNFMIDVIGLGPVTDSVNALSPVEKELLCTSLTVAMKEKLGNPDIETCSPEDAAMYFSHSVYDLLAPIRKEYMREASRNLDDPFEEHMLQKDFIYKRNTELPVDFMEIFDAIMDRDMRDGGHFAQQVIDSIIAQNVAHATSRSRETQRRILDFTFRQLIDFFEEEDRLIDLREFFSSHNTTSKYARLCSRRLEFSEDEEVEFNTDDMDLDYARR